MRVKLVQTSGVSIARSLCRTNAWCLLASTQRSTRRRGAVAAVLMKRSPIIVRKNRRKFPKEVFFLC